MAVATDESSLLPENVIGPRSIYRARAIALAGFNPLDPMVGELFDDILQSTASNAIGGWQPNPSGSGASICQVAGTGGGVAQITTGVTLTSQQILHTTHGLVSNVSTARWYTAIRFRLVTVPDATSRHMVGIGNFAGTKTILVGFIGGLNATNFIVQYDGKGDGGTGTAVDLGVLQNQTYHVAELYGKASTTLNAGMDGTFITPVVMASAAADAYRAFLGVQQGAIAVAQTLELDWFYSMFTRV